MLNRILDWSLRQELNRLLPATLTIPSGREATLRYDEFTQPITAQEGTTIVDR